MTHRIRIFRHLLCRNKVWYAPDLAMFSGQDDNDFLLTCKECGHQKRVRGKIIRMAMEATRDA